VEQDEEVATAGAAAIFCADPVVNIVHTTDASTQIQVISNPFGKHVTLQGSLSDNLQINTSDWASGMYILKVMYKGKLVGKEKLMRQ